MPKNESEFTNPRRGFLGKIAAMAGAIGIASVASPLKAAAETQLSSPSDNDADAWFDKVKGKHRIVYDCTHPHEIFPFAWPKVFLLTNAATGTPEKDCGVVVILRHTAIGYAFDHNMWAKYHMGDLFGEKDHLTKEPAMRNPFWKPANDEYKLPGIGAVQIGINDLQASGVMFCVCSMAINVFSGAVAEKMKMDAATVKEDWMKNLIPGVQPVPSGVWAVGRAQEHGCHYCFAG